MRITRFLFTRNVLALSIKVIAVLGVTIAIYFQDLIIIANEALISELMSHVIAIPFLFAYLLHRKRKMLRATIPSETLATTRNKAPFHEIAGAFLCTIALLIYWYGSSTLRPLEHHAISLPIFIAGAILVIFNTQTFRTLIFPLAFLLFLTPPPSDIAHIAGAVVASLSSEASYNILKTIGLPVHQITEYGAPVLVVTNPTGSSISFVIGAASSGIYSLIGFAIFATFITYIARGPIWKKATLFVVSLPLIYALNILRIIILILIGYWQGVEAVWDAFHLFGGWILIFLGSLILLVIAEKIWKIRIFSVKPKAVPCPQPNLGTPKSQDFCPACGKLIRHMNINIVKRDLCKMAVLMLVTSLILSIQVPVFASMQRSTENLPEEVADYSLNFVGQAPEDSLKLPGMEELLYFIYLPPNSSGENLQVMVNLDIAKSWSIFHSWEISLISWPQEHGMLPRAMQIHDESKKSRSVNLLDNPPIVGLFSAFRDADLSSNRTLVALELGPVELKENAISNYTSTSGQRYAKITIYTLTNDPERLYEIEDVLLLFGEAIVNHWQPAETWLAIVLTLSKNGVALMTITTALFALILTMGVLKKLEEEKSNFKAYQKLVSGQEKSILQAVQRVSHAPKSTTSKIASCYQKITGNPIETDLLLQKLEEAEKAGLIEKDIASLEDEPILIWKSRMRFPKAIF